MSILEELRGKIESEVEYVDIRPYSHNIISIVLGQIAKEFCRHEANEAIKDFDLEMLGWSIEEGK